VIGGGREKKKKKKGQALFTSRWRRKKKGERVGIRGKRRGERGSRSLTDSWGSSKGKKKEQKSDYADMGGNGKPILSLSLGQGKREKGGWAACIREEKKRHIHPPNPKKKRIIGGGAFPVLQRSCAPGRGGTSV